MEQKKINMSNIRYGETCIITETARNKTVEAVVQDFKERDRLTVIVNKAIKLQLKWNGQCYEGRAAGMDFISDGPKVTKSQTSIRG